MKSNNEAWGFFGTLKCNYGASDKDAGLMFSVATRFIVDNFGVSARVACDYLDARDGRHLADALSYHGMENSIPTLLKSLENIPWLGISVLRFRSEFASEKK